MPSPAKTRPGGAVRKLARGESPAGAGATGGVGVAGDDEGEQVPRLSDEVHGGTGPESTQDFILRPGDNAVNGSEQGPICMTQVPSMETLEGRLSFFTVRTSC